MTAAERSSARPTVSVVVPFAGTEGELTRLLTALARLRLRAGDELIVADNRRGHSGGGDRGRVRICAARGTSAPGFARNRGAARATGVWLVLIDADTEPSPTLLDDYFTPVPAPATAVLAGAIVDRAAGPGVVARHTAARAQMSQQVTLARGAFAYAQSANCAVRRDAFVAAGGFSETARAGEDADLCFRLRAAGWQLESRPAAGVEHLTRERARALLAQLARHGSGAAWCNRRHPGSFPPPGPRQLTVRLLRDLARAVAAAVRGRRELATFAMLDLAEAVAFEGGRLLPNRPRRRGT